MTQEQPVLSSVGEPQVDPYMQQAMAEEQRLLDEAVQQAQLQHLMNRCMGLSVEVARLRAEKKDGDTQPTLG